MVAMTQNTESLAGNVRINSRKSQEGQRLGFLFVRVGLGIYSSDALWKNRKRWQTN
jgi:hypothetical protein